MRVRARLTVAARKIYTVIVLGIVMIATIVPVRDVAMGQGGTGSQPPGYTVKDIHPAGFADSYALSISGGQQVGYGLLPAPPDRNRALLWRGTAASVVDLTPTGPRYPSGSFDAQLVASGVSGGLQVGYGQGRATSFRTHAFLWNGTAASVVDLHDPTKYDDSFAFSIDRGQIVGDGAALSDNLARHALLWNSGKIVDLHPGGFANSSASSISGGQIAGTGLTTGGQSHALLWSVGAIGTVSAKDLHPTSGFTGSGAISVSGGQIVGFGVTAGGLEALLWNVSPSGVVSVTDLHDPSKFFFSVANATNGKQQVGFADIGGRFRLGGRRHALVWNGSATKVVDLNRFLPVGFTDSEADAIDSEGNVVGWAFNGSNYHAVRWTPSAVAVIVIPGLPGSWTPRIRDALAGGNFTNVPALAGDFASMVGTHLAPEQMKEHAVYDDLTNTLKSKGIDVFVMPWDWANGGYQQAAADLDKFVQSVRDKGFAQVDIIAHSAGGIVAQQYVQNRLGASADPHVRNLILLGTPNQGSLVAHCGYYVEFIPCAADNTQARLMAGFFQLVLNAAAFPLPVVQRMAAVHDTMPTFPYLQLDRSLFAPFANTYLQGLNQQTLSEINQFLAAGIAPYTVRGTAVPTPGIFLVRLNTNRVTRPLKPWVVTNIIAAPTFLGDGSSLAGSATIPGFNDVPVPNATHLEGLLNCIKEAYPRLRDIGTLACGPQVRRANTYIYIQTGSPVSILLADPRGRLTGTNFATGSDQADIPTSTLFQSDHRGIFIDTAIQGKYTLDVLGTGNGGEFELSIIFPNAFPTGLDTTGERFSRTIRAGQRLRFVFDALAFQGVTNLFASFNARLEINSASRAFEMSSTFSLGPGGTISPATQSVTIQIGTSFLVAIPPGSFRAAGNGNRFVFEGTVNGVALEANLTRAGGNSYSLQVEGAGARDLPAANPVEVRLGIGSNGGSVSVNAEFER